MKDYGIAALFKIYPIIGKNLYFTVYVFKTRREMHEYCRRHCTHFMGSRATAACHAFKRLRVYPDRRRDKMRPEIGSMHFYVKCASPQIVAHECSHAAIFWRRRIERKEVLAVGNESDHGHARGTEEAICLATGNLFYQINRAFWKYKIWK